MLSRKAPRTGRGAGLIIRPYRAKRMCETIVKLRQRAATLTQMADGVSADGTLSGAAVGTEVDHERRAMEVELRRQSRAALEEVDALLDEARAAVAAMLEGCPGVVLDLDSAFRKKSQG